MINSYYDEERVRQSVDTGQHRKEVGGMWEHIGQLQYEFLVANGLKPHHRLIDVGCGSLRGGVHFAAYLDAGNYYGIELNSALIEAGVERELKPLGLDQRVPKENLQVNGSFDFSQFNSRFDFALALSLFTHLPFNLIRTCLEHLAPHMADGADFFATVFETDSGEPASTPREHLPGGITTYGDRDPYHYRREDIAYLAASSGWTAEWIGDFDHPRQQQMIRFRVA